MIPRRLLCPMVMRSELESFGVVSSSAWTPVSDLSRRMRRWLQDFDGIWVGLDFESRRAPGNAFTAKCRAAHDSHDLRYQTTANFFRVTIGPTWREVVR